MKNQLHSKSAATFKHEKKKQSFKRTSKKLQQTCITPQKKKEHAGA
jgi:hypothetical protein